MPLKELDFLLLRQIFMKRTAQKAMRFFSSKVLHEKNIS